MSNPATPSPCFPRSFTPHPTPTLTPDLFNFTLFQLQRFGVTTKNPSCPETRVVRAVTDLFLPEGRDYWILSGSKVHNGDLEQDYSLNIHSLDVNDVIGIQVTCSGELNFFINGVNKGVAMKGIPTKKELYAVFDVYGRTKQVSWKYYGGETVLQCHTGSPNLSPKSSMNVVERIGVLICLKKF